MKRKDAMLCWCAVPIAAAIALVLVGCAQQAVQNQASPPPSPPVGTNYPSGWYLVAPPQRAYASDRSTMMGGPLATSGISENRGAYLVYSLTQNDTSAPLNKWQRVAGTFSSEHDCEDYKSGQMKKMTDPEWLAKESATNRYRVMSAPAIHDFLDSERCATSEQLSPH